MILQRLIGGIASNVHRISFSKRCTLLSFAHRPTPYSSGYIQNIGPKRFSYNEAKYSQMISSKERHYQQKDNLNHNYELIYFLKDNTKWSLMFYCLRIMQVLLIIIIPLSYILFEPPLERGQNLPLWKRDRPRFDNRYEIVVTGTIASAMLYFLGRGLTCTVSRIYRNHLKCEYEVIFLKHISERKVKIPYDCMKPKFNIRSLMGTDVIFTANNHTLVIYWEFFKNPSLASKVLTNRMANDE